VELPRNADDKLRFLWQWVLYNRIDRDQRIIQWGLGLIFHRSEDQGSWLCGMHDELGEQLFTICYLRYEIVLEVADVQIERV
jgi:hypothetical protein